MGAVQVARYFGLKTQFLQLNVLVRGINVNREEFRSQELEGYYLLNPEF
jgi:hypothetical protein